MPSVAAVMDGGDLSEEDDLDDWKVVGPESWCYDFLSAAEGCVRGAVGETVHFFLGGVHSASEP